VRRVAALAAAVVAALGAAAAPAAASRDQEATFQDDEQLIYVEKPHLERTLDTLESLGVDRLRITVLWKAIAPSPESRTRPLFDASNPDAYAPGIWTHYDNVVTEAQRRGMDVNFNVTGPGPLWANKPSPREDFAERYEPSPVEFGRFVTAVGRRYAGRVTYWSIWNEPNHSGWLAPTWDLRDGRFVERSASLYRELLAAAWTALQLTGHGADTVLIGETAPTGDRSKGLKRYMKPLVFVRALYCVDRRLRPLRGDAAARLGCPADPAQFAAAHPALFAATGFGHHPYQLLTAPSVRPQDRDHVTIGVLPRLTGVLDGIFRRYGTGRRLGLYLTEYGYQTLPDPFGITPGTQAAYLNQSELIAWRNPRVRTFAQFLLVDDGEPIGLTFQSGLRTIEGADKPAMAAYRLPIWVTRRGARTRVWGLLRPAAPGERVTAEIQYRRRGSKRWRRLRQVTATGPRNAIDARVRVPRGRGALRIAWGGLQSRTVGVRVR
jgi:hypothetical protein